VRVFDRTETGPAVPEDRTGLTVVAITQPTPNGPLHVGHLSGPYLAADVAARAARERGERTLVLAGVDVHQNYVLTRAQTDGIPVDELVDTYRDRILSAYRQAGVGWDTFVDPARDPDFVPTVAGFVAGMVQRGTLTMREMTLHRCRDCARTLHHSYVAGRCSRCRWPASGGSCEGCGGYTCAQTLLDPVCDRCGGQPVPFTATVPVLRMEDYRDRLLHAWAEAALPPRARAVVAHYLRVGLPDVPIAYPTDWGIPGTGPAAGLRVDVYAELGLSYLYGVGRAVAPAARSLEDFVAAWREVDGVWHFHGIDNTFYFALLIPALLTAAGLPKPPLAGLVVNEFLQLDGKKFSTSRNHAVWADELLATEDPALVRLYLCWNRPDRAETDFTAGSYAAFRDWAGPLLAGTGSRPARLSLPAALVPAELDRAEEALRPESFDPALAARAVLAVLAAPSISDAQWERASRLVGTLSGTTAGRAEHRGRAAA
jgi:methionyl-tRNA synthetase